MFKKNRADSSFAPHWWQDYILLGAIFIAAILHIFILFIHFRLPAPKDSTTQEIAVTLRPSEDTVEHTDFLSQDNQKGSGKFHDSHRMASDMPKAMPEQSAGEAPVPTQDRIQQKRELKFEEKVLMTVLSWQKQAEENKRKKAQDDLQSQFQAKAAMVASLEAQYLQRQQNFSRQQRIKTVDGIQAKKDASAAYLNKFREKVELYGNRYYPEEAKRLNLSGEVRLMVVLNAQGGIRAIRLIESSGHAILDEAAKASVRRGAPFGRFDATMKDISELRIVRTWKFDPAQAEFEVK